jgi:hypothetical protein
MLLPPGPEQSSLMMILRRGSEEQKLEAHNASTTKVDFSISPNCFDRCFPADAVSNCFSRSEMQSRAMNPLAD